MGHRRIGWSEPRAEGSEVKDNRDQSAMEPLAPDSYGQFLAELKSRIQSAQLRASLAVNRELVLLYWQIGRDILGR